MATASTSASATDALWDRVLAVLERDPQISRASYATWLKGTRLLARDGDRFTVGAQHTFARDKLQTSFSAAVARAFAEVTGEPTPQVAFVVPGVTRPSAPEEPRSLPLITRRPSAAASHNVAPTTLAGTAGAPPAAEPSPRSTSLNPRLTLTSFIAGPGTQFALTAAKAVAENPVLAYNPLFLYGDTGLGKTHLLHGIGNAALHFRPTLRVVYLPAAQLLEALEDETGRAALAAVLARYAALDVFLLDAIHELAGHPSQKHVLLLLETLVTNGKQVVCAADSPPRAVAGLDERLRAFLQSGLVADLAPPDDETRVAILRAKAELRGAATPRTARRRPTPQHVLRAVSLVFGVPVEALIAPRRDRQVVVPRHVAMHLMREETGASLSEIGAALGGRDHSTVLHGCEKIARELELDGKLREHVAAAHQLISAAVAAAHVESA